MPKLILLYSTPGICRSKFFNLNIKIRFTIPDQTSTAVTLRIFDILGNKIRTLVKEERSAGTYEIQWVGKNDNGFMVSSGIYFLKLQFNRQLRNLKLMLLK